MTLLDLISRDTTLCKAASTRGGEYAGPCPRCGGRDRFRVWPAEQPRFWCRQCRWAGDAIQYLRDRDGLAFREACQRLGAPKDRPTPAALAPVPRPPRPAAPPGEAWQARARAFCDAAADRLWAPEGARALAYLRRRGLADGTIRAARLGAHAHDVWEPREAWGLADDQKKIWLPAGVVFPWCVGSAPWRISLRRVGDIGAKDHRYVVVSGSANALYGADTLRPNLPAVLVEGVLDALSLVQEAGDLAAVVATGSTTGGRLERWVGRLALASVVLVSFDADAAGEQAAGWWLKALGPTAKRWRPYWEDPNALLQAGVDLRTWVREGCGGESPWWRTVARWPEAQRERWAERAALMEVEGGLRRTEAEYAAFRLLVEHR